MKHKSLKNSIISLIFCLALSAGAFSAAFYFVKADSDTSAYFFGAGTGTAAVAVAMAIKIAVMLKNPKYRKEQETAQKDERLISLRNRSMAVSYYITVIGVAIASIVFAVKGDMHSARNLSTILCFSFAVYLIAYLVLSHKE